MKEKLATIVEVESRLRKVKTIHEAYLLGVNLFRMLFSYEMAISFAYHGHLFKAIAHSDIPELNKKSPFITNIAINLKKIDCSKPTVINSTELSDELKIQGIEYLLLMPLIEHTTKRLQGVIIYGATHGFSKEALVVAEHCSETISLVIATLEKKQIITLPKIVKYSIVISLIFCAMLLPIHISTQGKGQVIAQNPTIVTAPMNGIIKKVAVKSNEQIKVGVPLLWFDDIDIKGKQQIAAQTINISASEIIKQERASFFDPSIKNKLEESRAEKAVKSMEYSAISKELQKLTVYAQKDGMVVLDAPLELIGKPVKTGEKLLSIVEPSKVEIEILVNAFESNVIKIGDTVHIYLDKDPMHPLLGEVYKMYYEPVIAPSGILSYKAFAHLAKGQKIPAIGMCGNIKIKGEKVSLFWYLFRKPIAYLRWYFG